MIDLKNVQFSWPNSTNPVINLSTLSFKQGEHVFIKGASGSGKSTLLNIIGGVLTPQSGRVNVFNHDYAELSATQRDKLRANHVGFIFQQFNLIPYLSMLENVMLPCRFSADRYKKSLQRSGSIESEARYLLNQLYGESTPNFERNVSELSVGQQQRVAAARALMGQPELVIADEPTSSLDFEIREAFMALLFDEVKESNSTLLFVSHDPTLQSQFDRHLDMNAVNNIEVASQ
jgi:putative ABC transport system ATP-binding protein